jgi:hypothetical protein
LDESPLLFDQPDYPQRLIRELKAARRLIAAIYTARDFAHFLGLIIVSLHEGEDRLFLIPGKKPILPRLGKSDHFISGGS